VATGVVFLRGDEEVVHAGDAATIQATKATDGTAASSASSIPRVIHSARTARRSARPFRGKWTAAPHPRPRRSSWFSAGPEGKRQQRGVSSGNILIPFSSLGANFSFRDLGLGFISDLGISCIIQNFVLPKTSVIITDN
jgi:hypothetical protein